MRLGGRQPSVIPVVKNVQREAALAALGANWEDYKHIKHTPIDHKHWHSHPAQIVSVWAQTHTDTHTPESSNSKPSSQNVEIMTTNRLNNEAKIRGFTSSEPHPGDATGVYGITLRMMRNQLQAARV